MKEEVEGPLYRALTPIFALILVHHVDLESHFYLGISETYS